MYNKRAPGEAKCIFDFTRHDEFENIFEPAMLEEYRAAYGRDLVPKSGPKEREIFYIKKARSFYLDKIAWIKSGLDVMDDDDKIART